MTAFKLLTISSILILASCSTKTDYTKVDHHFNSSLDLIEAFKGEKVATFDNTRYATAENFEVLLKEQKATFVVFGMVSNDYSDLKKNMGLR